MQSRRDRRRFRPTLDALPLRLAPGGLTPLPSDPSYLTPTFPGVTPATDVDTAPTDYLTPTAPTTSC